MQPGSFLLGKLRFGGDALLGPASPTASGRLPNLPDPVTQEAYSHEVSSAGFWPGSAGIEYPAFYSYAYPAPPGFSSAPIRPKEAFYSEGLREYILPYDAVRTARDPDRLLLNFLMSTYEAAAVAGEWDRTALECSIGAPGRPRTL